MLVGGFLFGNTRWTVLCLDRSSMSLQGHPDQHFGRTEAWNAWSPEGEQAEHEKGSREMIRHGLG